MKKNKRKSKGKRKGKHLLPSKRTTMEGLDEFEVDGFIVDNDEDEDDGGEEENPKEALKKKKKRKRSSKNVVLDDDDLELIRENKSINQEKLSDGKFKRLKKTGVDTELMEHSSDEGSLFDDVLENESNDAEDDMADFIVDEEVAIYGKGDSLSDQKKFKDMKHSSSLSKDAKHGAGKAGLPEEHIGSEDPKNMYIAGGGNSVADIHTEMQKREGGKTEELLVAV